LSSDLPPCLSSTPAITSDHDHSWLRVYYERFLPIFVLFPTVVNRLAPSCSGAFSHFLGEPHLHRVVFSSPLKLTPPEGVFLAGEFDSHPLDSSSLLFFHPGCNPPNLVRSLVLQLSDALGHPPSGVPSIDETQHRILFAHTPLFSDNWFL